MKNKSNPTWGCLPTSITKKTQSWLTESQSMTARMEKIAYPHPVTIKRLKQIKSFPSSEEKQAIYQALSSKSIHCEEETSLLREITMSCQHEIWMFARTVFTPDLLRTPQGKALHGLANYPLGKLLFQDPNLIRTNFEYTQLNQHHTIYQSMQHMTDLKPTGLFARRSLFFYYQQPLLLTEVFFPALLQY